MIPEWLLALIVGGMGGLVNAVGLGDLVMPRVYRDEHGGLRLVLGFLANVVVGIAAGFAVWCSSAGADFDTTKLSPIRLVEAGVAGVVGWPIIKAYADKRALEESNAESVDTLADLVRTLKQYRPSKSQQEREADANDDRGGRTGAG